MNAFARSIKTIFLILAAAFLAGCASMGQSEAFATQTLSNKAFMALPTAEKAKYLQAVQTEATITEQKEALEYRAGRPIYTGDGKTGRTIQWDKKVQVVYVYPGHNPDGMGIETFGAMGLATDQNGVVKAGPDGGPLKVFLNVAAQEDMTRAMLKVFAGAVPAAFNGVLAAQIQADSCSKNGCGSGGNLINVQTNSGAAAESSTNGTIGVTTSGGCGSACKPNHAK